MVHNSTVNIQWYITQL